jgi:hypothetical protein
VPLARQGMRLREQAGRITGRMPFERTWMADFVDRRLEVDASQTRRLIDWAPDPNLSVLKCLPRLVENLKRRPEEWRKLSDLRKKTK